MNTQGVLTKPGPILKKGARFLVALLVAGMLLASDGTAQAASGTWVGATASGTWNYGVNWSGGSVPADGATLTFGSANGGTTTLDTGTFTSDGGLTFTSSTAAYTINQGTGGTLSLSGGIQQLGAVTVTMNNSMTLSGATVMNINQATGTLTLAGILSGTGSLTQSGAGRLTLTGANTYTGLTTINGGTLMFGSSGGTTPSANSIVVNSGGVLTFGRSDTWGNDGTPASAAITINSGGTLASGGFFTTLWNPTLNGGTVLLNGGANATYPAFQFAGTLTATGASSVVVGGGSYNIINSGGTGTGNGVLTVNTPNATDSLTINAPLQTNTRTTGALTKIGSGTLTLTGANTYSGNTIINGGVLQIGAGGATGSLYSPTDNGAGSISFGSAGSITLNNNSALVYNKLGGAVYVNQYISGNGSLSVINNSTLTGQGIDFASGTTITTTGPQTYTCTATGQYQGLCIGPGSVTLTSGGSISISGQISGAGYTTGGSLTLDTSGGNGNITLNTAVGINGLCYNITSLTLKAGTGTINVSQLSGVSSAWRPGVVTLTGGSVNSTASMGAFTTLTVNNSSAGTFSGAMSAGGGAFVKQGGGELTFTAANTYTGTTVVNAGTLTLSGGGMTGGGAVTVANAAVMNIQSGSTLTIGAGGFFVGSGSGVATVNQTGGSVSFTDPGLVLLIGNSGNPTATYNMSGGTLTGSTANASRGIMLGVNAGSAGSPVIATFNLSGGIINMGSESLAVGRYDAPQTYTTATYSQTGGTANFGTLTIGSAGTTTANFSVTGGSFTASNFPLLGGTAPHTASMTIGGTATVSLPAFPTASSGGNTYLTFDGGTLVAGGVSSASYMNNIFTAASITSSGANIVINTGTSDTIAQIFTGVGGLNKYGAGTLTLSGLNTYTGPTTINAGILSVGTLTENAAGNMGSTTAAAGNLVINGGALQYTGAGIATARQFTLGANGGTLDASGIGGITWNGTTISMSGSATSVRAFNLAGNGSGTLATVISDNGSATSLTKSGAGAWYLSGANTYTGPTTVNAGILSVGTLTENAAGNMGSTTTAAGNLVINGGALQYTGAGIATARQFTLGANGGTLDASGAGGITWNSASAITLNPATSVRAFNLAGSGSGTLAAVIGDNGSATALTKSGTGTWYLSGANTYSGATTVNAGVLALMGSGTISSSPTITVANGATLNVAGLASGAFTLGGSQFLASSGTGNFVGNMNVGGILSPGGSAASGVIAFNNGTVAFTSGGQYLWTISNTGSAAGAGYDTLSNIGTLDLTRATSPSPSATAGRIRQAGTRAKPDNSGRWPVPVRSWVTLARSR